MSTSAPALAPVTASSDHVAPEPAASADAAAYKVVENRTGYRIGIRYRAQDERCLVLPPFGERRIDAREVDSMKPELGNWTCRGLVRVRTEPCRQPNRLTMNLTRLAVWSVPLAAAAAVARPSLGGRVLAGAAIAWAGLLIFGLGHRFLQARQDQGEDVVKQLVDTVYRGLGMLMVLAIGLGVPGTLLWTQRKVLDEPPGPVATMCLVLTAVFVIFVAVVATLPALLFFLFQQHRRESARTGFFREVMRIDPGLQTLTDAEAVYGLAVDEAYGERKRGMVFNLSLVPVLLSTLLMTLGWTAALLPTLEKMEERLTDFSSLALADFLAPQRTAFTFAFLGAYFFTLTMVFRRYVRADLGPKAYSHISMRIIVAMVLAWVSAAIPHMGGSDAVEPAAWLLIFAFFVGIVPETGTAVLHDFVRTGPGKVISALEEKDPLSKLEGITLYDRARLLEEGIENVENLAHHDLIDLMLRTRIPTPRVVDLVDQAILYLHVRNAAGKNPSDSQESLESLRRIGVRTATDLLEAEAAVSGGAWAEGCGAAAARLALHTGASSPASAESGATEAGLPDLRRAFYQMLGEESGVPRLRMICIAIRDDEWMVQLRHWRETRTRCDDIKGIEFFARPEKLMVA